MFLRTKNRRLGRDQRGIAAVEFAFIAPVLVMLFFGSIELSLMMQAKRKVTIAAATVADLTTQYETMTEADMDNIFTAASRIMDPFEVFESAGDNTYKVRFRVTSIDIDASSNVTVGWTRSRGISSTPPTDLPTELIKPDTTVIVGEVEFLYDSQINLVKGQYLLSDRFFMRPRLGSEVGAPTS